MKIRNSNKEKCFTLPAADVKKGGLKSEDGTEVTFRPGDVIDMDEEKARRIADTYPNIDLMEERSAKKAKKGK